MPTFCGICLKPASSGCVTCGSSECQEQDYKNTMLRTKKRSRKAAK